MCVILRLIAGENLELTEFGAGFYILLLFGQGLPSAPKCPCMVVMPLTDDGGRKGICNKPQAYVLERRMTV